MKLKTLLIVLATAFALTAQVDADARGKGNSSRHYYGGGKHTYSHGGHYSSGHGSSHKGGHYKNPPTSNRYGKHK